MIIFCPDPDPMLKEWLVYAMSVFPLPFVFDFGLSVLPLQKINVNISIVSCLQV